jgi:cardiolipin synthase (CMP-forming)
MYKRLNSANRVTFTRLILVLILNYLLIISHGQSRIFILIVCLLALNYAGDVLDGYLARKMNQVTRVGAVMDVIVDSLLMLGAYFILAYKGIINYYLFYLALTSLIQFVISSLWTNKFRNSETFFTFDTLGHYFILLMEIALVLNIAIGFLNVNEYAKIVSCIDLFIIGIGVIAIINRFKYYIMTSKIYSA